MKISINTLELYYEDMFSSLSDVTYKSLMEDFEFNSKHLDTDFQKYTEGGRDFYTEKSTTDNFCLWILCSTQSCMKERKNTWEDSLRLAKDVDIASLLEFVKVKVNLALEEIDYTPFILNDDSLRIISSRKKHLVNNVVKQIQILDDLIGVKYLFAGLCEQDHKKFRKKVRTILQNLHYKSNYGYALESLTKSHIFSCLFEYSVYGLKFTSQFIKEFNNENFT